jgi:hypothetical protein
LKIGGVFITQYDGRKVLNRDVVETINAFKSEVLKQRLEIISRWRKRHKEWISLDITLKVTGRTIWTWK